MFAVREVIINQIERAPMVCTLTKQQAELLSKLRDLTQKKKVRKLEINFEALDGIQCVDNGEALKLVSCAVREGYVHNLDVDFRSAVADRKVMPLDRQKLDLLTSISQSSHVKDVIITGLFKPTLDDDRNGAVKHNKRVDASLKVISKKKRIHVERQQNLLVI